MPSRASRPPKGATILGERPEIGCGDTDHAFLDGHQGIGGEPPDMALAKYRAGGDIGGLGLFDRQRHGFGVDVEAEPPMAVDHGRGRRFLHDGPFRAGYDMAGLDAIDIGRDRDDAVRVMAGEIGVDAADRHGNGLLVRRAGSPEQRRADARETVGLDDRHGFPHRWPACEVRVLFLLSLISLSLISWSQSGGLRARAECPVSHAA